MKHLISVILAAMAILAGIAAIVYANHLKLAVFLWVSCGLLGLLAIVVGIIEGIAKPHIVIAGYGRVNGQIDGILIENDGEPAYNVLPPSPVLLGSAKVVFDDPIIKRLTKEQGRRCFEVSVVDSIGHVVNKLPVNMALYGVDELSFEFRYADGRNPMIRRYTTRGKLKLNAKDSAGRGISAIFAGQSINWLFLRRD
jgi:hypothetical protein